MRITTVGLSLVTMAVGVVLVAPVATAATDASPPSVPQNLHTDPARAGNTTVTWDASVDNSGSIFHYWVFVDGQQRAKPVATTYDIKKLVDLCRIAPGTHTITVQAVDRALNRSAQSNAVVVTVS